MSQATSSLSISRPPDVVWSAIADITRMGEWSPECVACRWIGDATAPAVGASFEGDNVAKLAGRTVKKWTTCSQITACEPGKVFEFVAEGVTTWRYELVPDGDSTTVTESFRYTNGGLQHFIYDTILRRPAVMTKGMQRTLERIKTAVESNG